jgi:hypothetical protein
MSDDLVKRLRDTANSGGYDIYGLHCNLELEAADRIEQLEAALAHIYAWYPVSVSDPVQTIKDIKEFARKALEKKSDPLSWNANHAD